MSKFKKILKRTIIVLLIIFVVLAGLVFGINAYVKHVGGENIVDPDNVNIIKNADCIIVLGCQVKDDGAPSSMLKDRLDRGIELYNKGVAPKIIMSGDHGQTEYDEVNTMKQYAIDAGIPSEDIFMDHAGFSTYESIYRARDVFKAETIVVVTQEYHLYRALYIADALDVTAYGVSSDYHTYGGQVFRDIREILARNKDFLTCVFEPEPTFLGDAIPVSGDGNLTND